MLKTIFGSISALLSLVGIAVAFFFTYIPWIETDDGDYISISGAHNQCQNDIIALFASQDCADVESLWLAGNGCCGLSLIVLIFSFFLIIMPSRKKETTIVTNSPKISQIWGTNCPKCNSVNMTRDLNQMEGQITCIGCGFIHSPVSWKKIEKF